MFNLLFELICGLILVPHIIDLFIRTKRAVPKGPSVVSSMIALAFVALCFLSGMISHVEKEPGVILLIILLISKVVACDCLYKAYVINEDYIKTKNLKSYLCFAAILVSFTVINTLVCFFKWKYLIHIEVTTPFILQAFFCDSIATWKEYFFKAYTYNLERNHQT